MKKIMAVMLAAALAVTGCATADNGAEEMAATTQTATTEAAVATTEAVTEKAKAPVTMPTLPDMDFEGLTFKEDGYEIVQFKSLADGDTANFVVGGMTMAVRFLAIDTPETSGSGGLQPWALKAKAYTKEALENAEVIIVEKDLESDIIDKYGRLLGWIWVDGELLQYKLVEEGLAYVKYLYGDYKYNGTMIALESSVQKTKVRIWGEDDPDYDYDDSVKSVTIKEARALQTGTSVTIRGVVTNTIGQNAFISDGTASIYIYANKYNYGALGKPGTEVELTGKIIEYNGLSEISSIVDKKITTLSEGNDVVAKDITADLIGEDLEGDYVALKNLTVTEVVLGDGGGYDIRTASDKGPATIRIDKYLKDAPDPATIEAGMVMDVVGSIGQYLEHYQVMISDASAITVQ